MTRKIAPSEAKAQELLALLLGQTEAHSGGSVGGLGGVTPHHGAWESRGQGEAPGSVGSRRRAWSPPPWESMWNAPPMPCSLA